MAGLTVSIKMENSSRSGAPSITGCSPIEPAVLKYDEVAYSDEAK
jgi:hypothetical protein